MPDAVRIRSIDPVVRRSRESITVTLMVALRDLSREVILHVEVRPVAVTVRILASIKSKIRQTVRWHRMGTCWNGTYYDYEGQNPDRHNHHPSLEVWTARIPLLEGGQARATPVRVLRNVSRSHPLCQPFVRQSV